MTFLVLPSNSLVAQEVDTAKNYTAYEFMSKYYNEDFKPFKKKNIYIGLAFSLENKQKENTTGLLQNIVDGNSLSYNLELKSGYYISNNTLVGFNFLYNHNKFTGVVFRDPDTIQSHSISRSCDFTPNIRPSIPLTSNDRLSFFIEIGLTIGYSSALVRDIKNIDVIDKKYTEAFHFRQV